MKCAANTCEAPAECSIALNVPAMKCPIPEHDPIRVILGLELCGPCADACKAKDFLTSDGRLKAIISHQARGLAEPDFDRAFVTRVSLDSEEYKMLKRNRN